MLWENSLPSRYYSIAWSQASVLLNNVCMIGGVHIADTKVTYGIWNYVWPSIQPWNCCLVDDKLQQLYDKKVAAFRIKNFLTNRPLGLEVFHGRGMFLTTQVDC